MKFSEQILFLECNCDKNKSLVESKLNTGISLFFRNLFMVYFWNVWGRQGEVFR